MQKKRSAFTRLKRHLLLIVIAGSVVWFFFCLVAGAFVWLVSRQPPYGDDTGFGILCFSIPIATICAVLTLYAFRREFLSK
jgi:hypothetical protein